MLTASPVERQHKNGVQVIRLYTVVRLQFWSSGSHIVAITLKFILTQSGWPYYGPIDLLEIY